MQAHAALTRELHFKVPFPPHHKYVSAQEAAEVVRQAHESLGNA